VALVDVTAGLGSRGDRTTGLITAKALAASGLLVVSLDFRQARAQASRRSARTSRGRPLVRANGAGSESIPPRRARGSSSGGHLALLAGEARRPTRQHAIVSSDGSLDARPRRKSVAFVLALYPVADPLARFRYGGRAQEDRVGLDASG